jgi:hypothetical protein
MQQKTNLKKVFCILLFEGTFTSFKKNKVKKRKEVTTLKDSGSGSIPLTNGSGSRRPKNIWTGGSGIGSAALLGNIGFLKILLRF